MVDRCISPMLWCGRRVRLILSDKTGPAKRSTLIAEVLALPGGAEALAQDGLDPNIDPETVHMVVDGFFAAGKYNGHLGRICQLLLLEKDERLKEKIQLRIRQYGSPATKAGAALRQELRLWATGIKPGSAEDAQLRRAAARALGSIEHRDALESLAHVLASDQESHVRDEARDRLADVLPMTNKGFDARGFLSGFANASYADFMRMRAERAAR